MASLNGIALTGIFSDLNPANGDRPGLHRRTYHVGTVIEYDSIAHHLNATLAEGGTTNLISTGGIHIVGPIIHEGDYTQTGNYTQKGNQAITGKITVSDDVVATVSIALWGLAANPVVLAIAAVVATLAGAAYLIYKNWDAVTVDIVERDNKTVRQGGENGIVL